MASTVAPAASSPTPARRCWRSPTGSKTISQNHWPSLERDIGAINDALYMLFSAGFYYKTFMWPKCFWNKVYEPFIRSAAGLGIVADRSRSRHAMPAASPIATCWSSAPARPALPRRWRPAAAAPRSSSSTSRPKSAVRCSASPTSNIDGSPAWDWLRDTTAALAAMPNVTLLPRTTAIGYYHQNMVGLCQRLTDHLADAAAGRAARAPVAGPRQAGRAGAGRHREAAGVRRQRPAGRHAGGLGADLSQPLRRQGRQPAGGRHLARLRPGTPPSTSPGPAPRSPRSSMSAPAVSDEAHRPRQGARHRDALRLDRDRHQRPPPRQVGARQPDRAERRRRRGHATSPATRC